MEDATKVLEACESPSARRSAKPLDLQRLQYAGADLWFALVNPLFEAPTAEMRAALPREVPMASQIHNAAMGGTLVLFPPPPPPPPPPPTHTHSAHL